MQRLFLRSLARNRNVEILRGVSQHYDASESMLRLYSSSADSPDKQGPQDVLPKRHQLMMINGLATTDDYETPKQATSEHSQTQASKGGSQLLMDSSGTVSSQRVEASDTSDGTSDEEEASSSGFQHEDAQLFEAALQHVHERGWTVEAMRQGATDLGLSPAIVTKYERPQASLVFYFVARCNWELSERLKANRQSLMGMKMSDRVQTAIQWRLEMLIPYMSSWSQALALLSSPASLPQSLSQLSKMVDDIWHVCGDASADFSWYTKRAALAGIYAATEAYMLTDYSPGYADTWEALGRRMQDVAQLGKLRKQAATTAKDIFQSAFSALQQAVGNQPRQ